MAENGISKKASITMSCITGVLGLAANVEDKLPFALIIAGMFFVYLIGQGFLDWLKARRTHDKPA